MNYTEMFINTTIRGAIALALVLIADIVVQIVRNKFDKEDFNHE